MSLTHDLLTYFAKNPGSTAAEAATRAAMTVARHEHRRAEVYALVPIGRAKRGAEWEAA